MNDKYFSSEVVPCPQCGTRNWRKLTSQWRCENGHVIMTQCGLPDFSSITTIADHDRDLRDRLYNGLLGRYYGFMMPLLSMPARPIGQSLPQWAAFFLTWMLMVLMCFGLQSAISSASSVAVLVSLLIIVGWGYFLYRHSYLFWLLLVAIPVKTQILLKPYQAEESFPAVHGRWLQLMKDAGCKKVLDVSTGTCNSLLRHGWTSLDAEFYGVDLSPTMLLQGADNAARSAVPVQLFLGDAQRLPFPDASMDLLLNYGALNGYEDQHQALAEMHRVLKPGGYLVCLDEQLYSATTPLQRVYFEKVLASHDRIRAFPASAVPSGMEVLELHQIYQFYYLALLRKSAS